MSLDEFPIGMNTVPALSAPRATVSVFSSQDPGEIPSTTASLRARSGILESKTGSPRDSAEGGGAQARFAGFLSFVREDYILLRSDRHPTVDRRHPRGRSSPDLRL